MISFTVQGKKVDVYPSTGSDRPIVYLHTFGNQGAGIYRTLQNGHCPDFTLVALSGLDWNSEMTPWDCPPISRFDKPCTGGADDYLRLLVQEIMPEAEKNVDGDPAWRGLSGYSLAGLFAVYALYQTDLFTRIASMSGSLWFPDFKEYVFSHDMRVRPDHVFFSLGEKECKARSPYLKSVQDNTYEISRFYVDQGIDSVFKLNPGNHYSNARKRTAAGIDWILRRQNTD